MTQITFNEKFRNRTKDFALKIIQLYIAFPKNDMFWVIGKQLLRSSTSVAANCRARSLKERYAKLCIVAEESDETLFWLELLEECRLTSIPAHIKQEALELTKVMSNYRSTLKNKL